MATLSLTDIQLPSSNFEVVNNGLVFGMSKREVSSLLGEKLHYKKNIGFYSQEYLYGMKTYLRYGFSHNTLDSFYYINGEKIHDLTVYDLLVEKISKQYGAPEFVVTNWLKSDFLGIPSMLKEAFQQGHAIAKNGWTLKNGLKVCAYLRGVNNELEICVAVSDGYLQLIFHDALLTSSHG